MIAALGQTVNAGQFWNDVNQVEEVCTDYTAVNNPACWKNMMWAMTTGVKGVIVNGTNSTEFYPRGATTEFDFQCALALKGKVDGVNWPGSSWNCSHVPCSFVSTQLSYDYNDPQEANTSTCRHYIPPTTTIVATMPATTPLMTTTTTTEAPASVPVWAWILLGAAIVGMLVAAVLFLTKQPAIKKKRAVRPPPPPPLPVIAEPLPTYKPVVTYMTPSGPRVV